MNPLLQEIYSTIIPSMPYIIAAYVLVLVCVLVWAYMQFSKQKKLAAQLQMLEEELELMKRREGKNAE